MTKQSSELQVEFERPLRSNETYKGLLQKKKGNKIVLIAILNVLDDTGKIKDTKYINLKAVSNEEN